MRSSETFSFDSEAYSKKIAVEEYTFQKLAVNIYRKRRAIKASSTAAFTGVLTSHLTLHMNHVKTAKKVRNIVVEKQKLDLLEAEWARRGQEKLPNRTLTDTLIPIAITGTSGLVAFSVDINSGQTLFDQAVMGVMGYDGAGLNSADPNGLLRKGKDSVGAVLSGVQNVSSKVDSVKTGITDITTQVGKASLGKAAGFGKAGLGKIGFGKGKKEDKATQEKAVAEQAATEDDGKVLGDDEKELAAGLDVNVLLYDSDSEGEGEGDDE